jgi:GntR family transcriptional regulator
MTHFGPWFDPLDPRAPYRQIADVLQAAIESGEYAPGDQLPSETRIGQEYGVARETARRAIRALRESGHALTMPGRGSFVPPDYRPPRR